MRALVLLVISTGVTAQASAVRAASRGDRARTRTYYIAADTVTWDYVAGTRDEIAGTSYADTAFFGDGKSRPVSTGYRKVLYREYTDSTFRTLKPRPPQWEHLGFLGPLIRGVVGDTIRVVFRNNGDRPYSVHPHGVLYDKASEGVPYNDGTSGSDKADDGVPPGGTHTYVWPVPERAGPGPMDGSSVMWMYHSHVDEVRDINTGLFGPTAPCRARGEHRRRLRAYASRGDAACRAWRRLHRLRAGIAERYRWDRSVCRADRLVG